MSLLSRDIRASGLTANIHSEVMRVSLVAEQWPRVDSHEDTQTVCEVLGQIVEHRPTADPVATVSACPSASALAVPLGRGEVIHANGVKLCDPMHHH